MSSTCLQHDSVLFNGPYRIHKSCYRLEAITWRVLYHLQKNQSNYDNLGGNYFDRLHSDGLKRYLVKRLQQLGHNVILDPMEAA